MCRGFKFNQYIDFDLEFVQIVQNAQKMPEIVSPDHIWRDEMRKYVKSV